ncbi:MAG TPA: hypothetical protein VFF48_03070 [Brevundimonas sp.]|nr:hypothetical protein [Brevundimonas sp.]
MKRTTAAAALTALLAVAGCKQDAPPSAAAAAGEVAAPAGTSTASAEVSASPEPPAVEGKPAAPGAPPFAVIYPGGVPAGPATLAQGPSGPGGIVRFVTPSSPDAVIAYYRAAAEAAGLTSVMAMNQGDARAYGAAAEDGRGKLLRVVATPTAEGGADVQLDWTAGN